MLKTSKSATVYRRLHKPLTERPRETYTTRYQTTNTLSHRRNYKGLDQWNSHSV